jgi:hypothetical protein
MATPQVDVAKVAVDPSSNVACPSIDQKILFEAAYSKYGGASCDQGVGFSPCSDHARLCASTGESVA